MIHPTADVSPQAVIGEGTKIWNRAQIREGANIGADCIIGKDVYVDFGVVIGARVKIQNSALVYHGVAIEDGVFIGPQVCLTNDKYPRAITPEGELKSDADWEVGKIVVRKGASLGAGSLILPDVVIGEFAMVAAGAIVSKSVPAHGLVVGQPARLIGMVCWCGRRMQPRDQQWDCPACGRVYEPSGGE
ncbi:MAG: N-acetyltransferase [Chloroflexi bacterium]|nr:N-acetyltransferase [Chloroflexota bacterium]